jgi:O-antigen/teichoic acid export membrane protein
MLPCLPVALVGGEIRDKRAGKRSYPVKAAAQLVVYTLLTQSCSCCATLLLAAGLGREGYGAFAFALTLQSFLFLFGCVGVKPIVLRDGIARPDELDQIATSHLVITAAGSGLACLVTIAAAACAPLTCAERLLLSLLAVGNTAACTNIATLFDVHHQQTRSAAITLVAEFCGLLAIAWLRLTGGLGLPAASSVFAGKWALATAGHYLVYHRSVRSLRLTLSPAAVRAMLSSSWPLMFSAVVATAPFGSGVLFLRWLTGNADAAIFGLANQVAYAYLLFAAVGNRIFQPHMAGPHGLRKGFVLRLALASGAFLGTLLLGALGAGLCVILFILGPDYHDAILPMAVLLAAACLHSVGTLAGTYLVVFGRERTILAANICAASICIAGCWLVVPRFSYNGAAGVVAAANLVGTGAILAAVRSRFTRR